MSAIATRAYAPPGPTLALLTLRLRQAAQGTQRLLAGLLPESGQTAAREAAVALELKLLGRAAR